MIERLSIGRMRLLRRRFTFMRLITARQPNDPF